MNLTLTYKNGLILLTFFLFETNIWMSIIDHDINKFIKCDRFYHIQFIQKIKCLFINFDIYWFIDILILIYWWLNILSITFFTKKNDIILYMVLHLISQYSSVAQGPVSSSYYCSPICPSSDANPQSFSYSLCSGVCMCVSICAHSLEARGTLPAKSEGWLEDSGI